MSDNPLTPSSNERSEPTYGENQPTYGENRPAYGENRPAHGEQSTYGQPTPGYGQQPTYGHNNSGYGQQPGYAYPGGGQLMDHPSASTVFLLGIIGIFFSICAYIAWYMGAQAKKQIETGAPYRWDGNLKTGYMLGKIFSIISIVLFVLTIVLISSGIIVATLGIH